MNDTMADAFTVVKSGRDWMVVRDGQVQAQKHRKRDALEAIPELVAYAHYENRVLSQDVTGIYIWTDEERVSIQQFAEQLRLNPTKLTLMGPQTIQEMAARDHRDEARTIADWDAFPDSKHGKFVCAELRRRRAGRVEAFKLAGVELPEPMLCSPAI